MKQVHVIWILSAALMASFGIPGCGEGGSGDAPAMQIAVIPKGTSHEFWKAVHAGAAAEEGVTKCGGVAGAKQTAPREGVGDGHGEDAKERPRRDSDVGGRARRGARVRARGSAGAW